MLDTKLERLIKGSEGLKLKPYMCSGGKMSIGYGRNLDDNGITQFEAESMFQNDLMIAARTAESCIDSYALLDSVRRAVVIDMAYNLGAAKFQKFEKMIAELNGLNYQLAAAEMVDSAWYHQVGRRSIVLVRMMSTGEWPTELRE